MAVSDKKPRVLLDVDGVIADFLTEALRVLNGIANTEFVYSDVTDWDIFKCLGVSKEIEDKCYEAFKRRGYASTLKPYPGSQEVVAQLLEHSDLYIVTSPILGSETWMHDRTQWLVDQFKIPAKRVIHAASKHVIDGDFLIDDKPSNVESWQAEHPNSYGVLWAQLYNRNASISLRRIDSWKEILDQVKKFKR